MNGMQDEEKKEETRKEKRELEKEIKKRKTFLDEQKLNIELADLEKVKDDSNKCYAVIKKMKKKKSSLFVNDKSGKLAGTDLAKAEIIQEHFRKMLAPDNQIVKDYPPTKLHQPFTTEEISQAARRMKNGSSPGCDDINGEYIKYASAEIHKYIADTLNRTFETGKPIEELQLGILTPLQKPGIWKEERPT